MFRPIIRFSSTGFLEDAFEFDVDCVCDGRDVVIGGVMEHIEEAGIHSGDSSCVLPPYMISDKSYSEMIEYTIELAKGLNVLGLMNVQFAVKDDTVYVLEVNPRASRTVPFVSKATGLPLAKIAAKVMAGRTLKELGCIDFDFRKMETCRGEGGGISICKVSVHSGFPRA